MKMQLIVCSFLCASGVLLAEWPTFNHDAQRSGWAREETKLTTASVGRLALQWSVQVENVPLALDALTTPVVARDVVTESGTRSLVYVAGSSNHLFAVDVTTGSVVWTRTFQSYVRAKNDSFFLCPNAMSATPVIDRGRNLIFALASDGRLYGLDLGTGAVRFGPFQWIPPMAKAWSLNLAKGFVYTTTSQGCGGDRSGIYSMKIDDPLQHVSYETLTRQGSGAGLWSRGGTAISAEGRLYVTTGDGRIAPENGDFGSAFLATTLPDLKIADYYSPLDFDELNKKDLDLPSGGELVFPYGDRTLVVGGGKDAVLYLLDGDALGSKDHGTPLTKSARMGNEERTLEAKGFWGSPAVWRDETGTPWIFVPLWGESSGEARATAKSIGSAPHGSVMAFRLEKEGTHLHLQPAWISSDVNLPDSPVVANGVVFVLATGENPKQVKVMKTEFKSNEEWKQNLLTTEERGQGTQGQSLLALEAKTGKVLYRNDSAMKSWNHFGGLAIDDGRVFAVDHSSRLYCFGLK